MNRSCAARVAGVRRAVFAISVAVLLAFAAPAQAQDQKKTNDEANAFRLADVIDTSTADSEVGDGTNPTGLRLMTPAEEAKMRKDVRVVKKVQLNKIGLARINEERAKKNLKPLVAGRDVDATPVGEDLELSAPGGGTPTATGGTETAPTAAAPAATLPSYVDNSTLQYFPPIRNQSYGSCAQWAGIYYNMTHEMALTYGWNAKSGGDYYRYEPMFSYNFVNDGYDSGSWMTDGWYIAQTHGIPRWSEFHTTALRTWCMNAAVYRNALTSRTESSGSIYDVDTDAGLQLLKSHLNNGHTVTYATYVNSWKTKTINNDPGTSDDDAFVGKTIVYMVNGTSGPHGMTVVGYNDNIWCDLNGNGTVDANEKGALRVANSWGTGWGEAGFRWVAYQALRTRNPASTGSGIFWSDAVYFVTTRAQQHAPKVVAKITINHNLRNQVYVQVGTGKTTATSPDTTEYPEILTYQGGAYAFSGAAATSQDFTYYLDFSDLAPTLGTAKRWFVRGTDSGSNNGDLTIKNFELYYTGAGVDQLVGVAANTPKVANGNTQYVWIDWTMGDVKPIVTWTTASQVSTNESGTLTVTAQLSSAHSQAVTVPFTVTGTATSGADYTITASPITIAAGATTGTATITIKSDTIHELNNETVILTMGTPTNALPGATTVHTATIKDDDNAAPVVNAGSDQTVPFSGSAPVPWTPASLSTAAWYDAAEGSTITASGGAVSQWKDKSGNSNHLIQATTTAQPTTGTVSINGLNAVDFDGSSDKMAMASNPFSPTINDALVILVHKVKSITAQGVLFSLSGSETAANRWQSHAPWSDGKLYFDTGGSTAPSRVSAAYGASVNNVVLTSYYGSKTDNVQQVYKNGTLLIGDATGHAVSTAGNPTVGGLGSYQNTSIAEIVMIKGTVSSAARQQLEGYLAHKWGLTANLPAGHPYKSAAPTVGGPSAIANLDGTVSDPDGDPMTTTWTVVSKPTGSTVTFGNASAVDTTATFTALGTYTLRLTATDTIAQAFDDVVITVIEDTTPNTAPVAFDDAVTTDQGVPVGITLNALDADGDPLTYIVSNPAHGTLSFGAVPDVLYTPDAGFSGTDSFTFKVNDGTVDSNTATVTITVNHVNTPPTIESAPWVDTNPVTLPNTTVAHVVASDVDGDPLTYTWSKVSGPGTLTFTPNGTTLSDDTVVSFSAAGSYTLQVSVSDGTASTTGTVAVTVNSNPGPTAGIIITTDNSYELYVNGNLLGTGADWKNAQSYTANLVAGKNVIAVKGMDAGGVAAVLADFTIDGQRQGSSAAWKVSTTAIAGWTDAAFDDSGWAAAREYGSYGVAPWYKNVANMPSTTPGKWIWSSDNSNHNTVYLRYAINVNTAPVATDGSVTTDQGVPVGVNLNASDADGNPLTYAIVSQPVNGTLSGTAPDVTYTPNAGFSGSDSFTFKVNDGQADSNVATVSITVNAPPVIAFNQDAGAQGLVSMEAEHYHEKADATNKAWTKITDTSASGGFAMDSAPDDSVTADKPVVMGYRVNFVKTGTHYVWVRGRAWPRTGTNGNADSVNIGVDGVISTTADNMSGWSTTYAWKKGTMDGPVATINVASTGLHTVNAFVREDGFVCDKIVLTTDANYTPSGTGPAESAQQ